MMNYGSMKMNRPHYIFNNTTKPTFSCENMPQLIAPQTHYRSCFLSIACTVKNKFSSLPPDMWGFMQVDTFSIANCEYVGIKS